MSIRDLMPESIEQDFLGTVTGRDGHPIYVDLRDKRGQALVKSGGNLNPLALALWHELLQLDRWTHIIDIGANYGEMLVNGKLPQQAKILAVEPNPRIFPYLKKTLSNYPHIALLQAAISEHEGEAEFRADEGWSGLSGIVEDGAGNLKVPTMPLDRILKTAGKPLNTMRVLIKIDVEGHETDCLKGLANSLPALKHFLALIEIAHLADDKWQWLFDHFDVFAFNLKSRALQKIDYTDTKQFREKMLYEQDCVVRRKTMVAQAAR